MDTNELYANVQATMSEINELLAKSMPMHKDGPEDQTAPMPEGMEGQAEQEAAEAPAPESPEQEGAEGQHDEMAELAAHAQSLSDEELDQMIQLLMQEKDQRSAAQAPAEGQAPAAPAPAEDEAQKAMKEEYAKMHKSMSVVIDSLEKLTKEVEAIKTKPAAKPAVQKAVVTNSQQVMQKSGTVAAKAVQRLNKSETEAFLLGRIRAKDPMVSSRTLIDLNYVQSDADLGNFQDSLVKQGVQFPQF